MKLIQPHSILIEQTAGKFAATWFDAARSSGMKVVMLQKEKINLMRYRNDPRKFAQAHLEKFIPAAVHSLIEIMSRPNCPEDMKEQIYLAIMERTNDEQLNALGAMAGLTEFENTPLYRADTEKPRPVIINTPKIDFNFDSKRV